LNFRESEGVVGNSAKVFVNKRPKRGEQPQYEGLKWTRTSVTDGHDPIHILFRAREPGILREHNAANVA
jgi:hypothetical protein